jgi:arylsulfatase A-like enzyme
MRLIRFAALLLFVAAPAMAADKPNFVFILVDDLARSDMSCEGSTFYETPNIDRIASRAMRFENGYAACQVCSPSRAAIQTGKYPARLKLTDFISQADNNQPEKWRRNTVLLPAKYKKRLPLEEKTIAEALVENGYSTFFTGKWHLGDDGHTPNDQGYQINVGGYHFGTPPGGYFAPYRNPKLEDGPAGEVLPLRLGRETAKFIDDHKDKPFFAMLSFYSVHGPIQSTQELWKKYQAKAEQLGLTGENKQRFIVDRTKEVRQVQDHPVYAGMMESMDSAVGLVLKAIDDANLSEETVVIFTGDNGGVSSGDGFATSSLPFRGGKGRQWEGGFREPYYISWPGVTNGQTSAAFATGTDFYPTILEIAGLDAMPSQHVDGVSLVPALKGKPMPDRDLFWHYPHYGNQGGEPSSIIRRGDWKLIHYFEDGRRELYNLKIDEGEQNNMAAQQPLRMAELGQALDNWLKSVDAALPTKNPNWDEQKYAKQIENLYKTGHPRREREHAKFLNPTFKPRGGWWQDRGKRQR